MDMPEKTPLWEVFDVGKTAWDLVIKAIRIRLSIPRKNDDILRQLRLCVQEADCMLKMIKDTKSNLSKVSSMMTWKSNMGEYIANCLWRLMDRLEADIPKNWQEKINRTVERHLWFIDKYIFDYRKRWQELRGRFKSLAFFDRRGC